MANQTPAENPQGPAGQEQAVVAERVEAVEAAVRETGARTTRAVEDAATRAERASQQTTQLLQEIRDTFRDQSGGRRIETRAEVIDKFKKDREIKELTTEELSTIAARIMEGSETFLTTYLEPRERIRIIVDGPEFWETLQEGVMSILTSDPASDVVSNQAFLSKLAALTELVGRTGAAYFQRERGYSPEQAQQEADRYALELTRRQNEEIHWHNMFRAILMATSSEEAAKAYQHIQNSWYAELSGASIDADREADRKRMTIGANRLLEMALFNRARAKHERYQMLKLKEAKGEVPLTAEEQDQIKEGYYLKSEELLPSVGLSSRAESKSHRQAVWQAVKARMAAGESEKVALERLLSERPQGGGRFTKDDERTYHQLKAEAAKKGVSVEEMTALTDTERQHLFTESYYSPVEMDVKEILTGMERARVREEAEAKSRKGDFTVDGQVSEARKARWISQQEARVDLLVRGAVKSARQHLIFSRRFQKIVYSLANVPFSAEEALTAPPLEYEARYFHSTALFMQRFGWYSQEAVQQTAGLARMRQLENLVAEKLGIRHTPEWQEEMAKAYKLSREEGKTYRDGAESLIKYLQKQTGLQYDLLVEISFVPIGGIYDVSGWRNWEIIYQPGLAALERQGKIRAIDDPNGYEFAIGVQYAAASHINGLEIARAAGDFSNLRVLASRLKKDLLLPVDAKKKTEVQAAQKHLRYRGIAKVGKNGEIRTKAELEERNQQSLEAIGIVEILCEQYRLADTAAKKAPIAKQIQDFTKGKTDFEVKFSKPEEPDKIITMERKQVAAAAKVFNEQVMPELGQERKRYLLKQMALRTPGVVLAYFPEYGRSYFDKIVGSAVPEGDRKALWEVTQKALMAMQNEVAARQMSTKAAQEFFETSSAERHLGMFLSPNQQRHLRAGGKFISKAYLFFNEMEEGKIGLAAQEADSGEAAIIGRRQFDLISRHPFDMNITMADTPYDLIDYDAMGGQPASVRRGGEAVGAAKASHHLNEILTKMHTGLIKPEDMVKEITNFIHTVAGWTGPEPAITSGRSVTEAWLEMSKASRAASAWLVGGLMEALARQWITDHRPKFRKLAKRMGSDLMGISENPNAPVMQSYERHKIGDLLLGFDTFIGNPKVVHELAEKMHFARKDITTQAIAIAMPTAMAAILGLLLAQIVEEMKKAGNN